MAHFRGHDITEQEMLEATALYNIQWRRAGYKIFPFNEGARDRGGDPISPADVAEFVRTELTDRNLLRFRFVQSNTNPRYIGIAYTADGRRERQDWAKWLRIARPGPAEPNPSFT